MTVKKIYDGVLVQSTRKDYPADWPKICELCSLFSYVRLTRYQFKFRVPLTELEKHL